MGKILTEITAELRAWIEQQKIFFVATAPLSARGHVNCSPKGADAFRVLDKNSVCYMDLTGSGIETVAHLQENGRIVVMFSGFEGPPQIVRLHGRGRVSAKGDEFKRLKALFPANPGVRSIIVVDVSRVSTSCGFSVPFFQYKADRDTLDKWAASKSEEALKEYRRQKNLKSIDDLSGLAE